VKVVNLFSVFSVQHILASTFAPRCVVWDLRKNEPIIKLTDSTSRVSATSYISHFSHNCDHSLDSNLKSY